MATISQLTRKRGGILHKLTNFVKFLDELNCQSENNDSPNCIMKQINELSGRLQSIESLVNEFEDVQSEIEMLCDEDDLENQYTRRDEFLNKYHKNVAVGTGILKQYNFDKESAQSIKNSNNSGEINSVEVKLPIIDLPKFDGTYENWLSYKDIFESLIHCKTNIHEIQKFHYLRASLGSDALKVIESLEFSATNYTIAWDLLCNRYNNKKLLLNTHIKALFNLEVITKESASSLRSLSDAVFKHMNTLKNLGQIVDNWDPLILYLISIKLDRASASEWEKIKVKNENITLTHMYEFLKSRANLIESLECNVKQRDKVTLTKNSRSFHVAESNKYKCNFCTKPHKIYQCVEFLKLNVNDRLVKVLDLGLCQNCLCAGHETKSCRSEGCRKCNKKHNRLLHKESHNETMSCNQSNNQSTFMANVSSQYVFLSTAKIHIADNKGKFHECTALLDSGSQPNFISRSLVKKLNLKEQSFDLSIRVVGDSIGSSIKSKCCVNLQSKHHKEFKLNTQCFILPQITGELPNVSFKINNWNIPKEIYLADPDFNKPKQVDLLIGALHFWDIIKGEKYYLGKGMPVLQNSIFGYLVTGQINACNIEHNSLYVTSPFVGFSGTNQVYFDLKKFWQLEEINSAVISKDDLECENIFKNTISRDINGQFIVRIPFKENVNKLGDSKKSAINQFKKSESKFAVNKQFKLEYSKFMTEYEILGHMSKVADEVDCPEYYFPHHAVFKADSLTSKIRVVFNGSNKSSTGYSLNDLQYAGPPIQNDILDILIRFRIHNFVVTSDVSKMYRCILIDPEQRKFQKIVWRNNPNEELGIYQLNTVTYGTTSAPFLALRCIKQLIKENERLYPAACEVIDKDFYVDDCITGFKSEQEALNRCNEIKNILDSAGFHLRKWRSNSKFVLESMSDDNDPIGILRFEDSTIKTLGIQWNGDSDTISYFISPKFSEKCSKRVILSDISKIYDPLGLISPCIIYFKLLIKKLWSFQIGWDEEVPQDTKNEWVTFRNDLTKLNDLKIPRHCVFSQYVTLQIHGFCDSSLRAYGACIYIRSVDSTGNSKSHLMCSKSRVAPMKPTTIPRLELCGAVLLGKLLNKVIQALKLTIPCFLWSDSEVVLWWIHSEPHKLQTFVANRVSQVQELTDGTPWNHVGTRENPADLITRGVTTLELLNNELWWNGPTWLSQFDPTEHYNVSNMINIKIPESRNDSTKVLSVVIPDQDIFYKFSSLKRLKRVIAYCLRFVTNCRKSKQDRVCKFLTVEEIESATLVLIKLSQLTSFGEEFRCIRNNKFNNLKNKFKTLAPFLDKNNILRVGGRLKHSSLTFDAKHPIVLDSKHQLSKLILIDVHERLLHTGAQLLLHTVRQEYWIIGGLNLAKSVIRTCINCIRYNPKPASAFMGDLPKSRVSELMPFNTVGIDYAGPFQIKDRKGRGCKITKGYICLFICFATKAIHLELVSDLTTENFIASLRRFTGRRGYPQNIWSDNGSNFIGASNLLKELQSFLQKSEKSIMSYCLNYKIRWHFIPPRSPHFGGLWESNIKNVKNYLLRIIANIVLTYEEFVTVLVQIEALVNSRPLYPLSNDPNDLMALTPSHFLVGRSIVLPPDVNVLNIPINRLNRYQLMQQLIQGFWKRWSRDYICNLQKRMKWKHQETSLKIGDMVLLKTENLPSSQWPLARVMELHPGKDGISRIATIKTNKGLFKRGIVKLCPLTSALNN